MREGEQAERGWEVARLTSYHQAVGLMMALEEAFGEECGLHVELMDCSDSAYPMLGQVRVMVWARQLDRGVRECIMNLVAQWR